MIMIMKIETRAKVAQSFGSGRTLVLTRSLMKRLESSSLDQITYEKVRKLLSLFEQITYEKVRKLLALFFSR